MLVISKFFLILISDNIWYFLMFYHSKSLYLSSCTVFSIDKQTNIFLIVINIDATDIAMDNQQVLFNVHKRDIIKKSRRKSASTKSVRAACHMNPNIVYLVLRLPAAWRRISRRRDASLYSSDSLMRNRGTSRVHWFRVFSFSVSIFLLNRVIFSRTKLGAK